MEGTQGIDRGPDRRKRKPRRERRSEGAKEVPRTDAEYIRQQIEDFDSDCNSRQHTDTGDAWNLFHSIYRRLGGDVARLSP